MGVAVLLSLAIVPDVFAEERGVVIVEGNISPTCIETQCYDPTTITIAVGDTVVWVNEDVPAHTIVSGSPFDGQDGAFDSGLILPEKTFKQTFVTAGEYPYFCVLHPWATGTVLVSGSGATEPDAVPVETNSTNTIVVSEPDETVDRKVQSLGFIGQKVGDGTSYVMTYISQGSIETSFVNQENNFILFTFSTPAPEGDEIIMKLNDKMIINPNFVEVNGVPITDYNYVKQNEFNVLMFKTPVETWEIKVYGTQVVPEFGTIALVILAVAIVSVVIVTRKNPIMTSNTI
jgi:predicted secreted protein with PEFG-CTERM motif